MRAKRKEVVGGVAQVVAWRFLKPSAPPPGDPLILKRDEHCISRKNIDTDCLKVMSRLVRHGHRAYLVGGAVRDLLLGKAPKRL